MNDRCVDYVRDLAARNVSRREILQIGATLGLSMAALTTILSEADALSALAAAGTGSSWPKTNVPEPKSPVTVTVSHAWEA